MTMIETRTAEAAADALQLATFYVGELLLGLDIRLVHEINRNLDITRIPHAPAHVRGVVNLRGDVITVIDMRSVLGMPPTEISNDTRNLIVHEQEELVGLCVDRVADIVTVPPNDLGPPPLNLQETDRRYIDAICRSNGTIVAILDVAEVLA